MKRAAVVTGMVLLASLASSCKSLSSSLPQLPQLPKLPQLPSIGRPAPLHEIKMPVGLPPGLEEAALTPLAGPARDRARQDLTQLRGELAQVNFLNGGAPETRGAGEPMPTRAAQRAYVEGRAAWRMGNNSEAKRQLQIAHRLAPGSAEILRLLGWIYTASGNKVKGAFYLQKSVAVDPEHAESLLLLSRFALEQGRWSDAIAGLTRVLDLLETRPDADPALRPLIRYYLAVALRHHGYAAEAAQQYDYFFVAPRDTLRSSRWARELLFLDRQHGQTAMALGDLLHQLDQPMDARLAYTRAGLYGVVEPCDLLRRSVYTDLRLSDANEALDRVVEAVRSDPNDTCALEMVGYVQRQGLSETVLVDGLQPVYASAGRPAALLLAITEMLPPPRARTLLGAHLHARPNDRVVFERLLRSWLPAEGASESERAAALQMTADACRAAPHHAARYARALIQAADNPQATLRSIEALPIRRRVDPVMLLVRALAQMAAGQRAAAGRTLTAAIATDPGLIACRLELIQLMVDEGRFERAAQLLEPLADHEGVAIVRLRVLVLAETGHAREALAELDRFLATGSTDTPLFIQKSRLLRSLDDPIAAEQTLLDALNNRPGEEQLYSELFEMYDARLVADSDRQYQRLMRRLFGNIPHSRLARYKRAEWLHVQSKYDEAEPLLVKLLAEDDRDLPAVRLLVENHVRNKRRDPAIALLEKLITTYPRDLEVLSLARGLYIRPIQDVDRLLEVERRILEIEPDRPHRSLQLAQILMVMKQPEQAIVVLERALAQENVENPLELLELLWGLLDHVNRPEEAEQRLGEGAQRFPDHAADIGYMRARLATQRGDHEGAESILIQVLKDHPDHAPSNNDLAYTWCVKNRNLDQALEMVNVAIDAEEDNAAYLDTKGWVLYMLRDFEGAATLLRKALDEVKRQIEAGQLAEAARQTQAVVGDHLGDVLYRLGQKEAAKREWDTAKKRLSLVVRQEAGELAGLRQRLTEKVRAVSQGAEPAVAELPEEGEDEDE